MEIIAKNGRSTINKWMEKVKDFGGFIKWGCMCVQS
jgi:hypothetical protein